MKVFTSNGTPAFTRWTSGSDYAFYHNNPTEDFPFPALQDGTTSMQATFSHTLEKLKPIEH